MLSELIILIEQARKLLERKSELDKEYFKNFVQPIWESFSEVHEDYKQSFNRYLDLISNDNCINGSLVGELIDIMQKDSIYSADLRSELESLIKYLPSSEMKVKEKFLVDFTNAILRYFLVEGMLQYCIVISLRNLRSMMTLVLLVSMEQFSSNENGWRKMVKEVVSSYFEHAQSRHKQVSDAYYNLRKNLLT